jgi:iron complex outermembrane receptor protein
LEAGDLSGEFGIARRDFGAQDFYAPYPSFERTRTYTSSIRWSPGGAGGSGIEAGFAFRRHEDEFTLIRTDPSVYQNRHTSSQAGGDALVRGVPFEGVSVVAGGELFRDFLRSNALGDRGETRGAVFMEAVIGAASPWVLSAGLREDWHQGFGSFLSPSISGSLRVGANVKLRGALGRSFRAPTWTERYYQDPVNRGREDLKPEKAWSGELGLDLSPGSGLLLELTGFRRESEDLIDWARPEAGSEAPGQEPPPWETRNIEEATFTGIEVDASGAGPLGLEWTFGGMWMSVESEEAPGFFSKYALRPLVEQVTFGLTKAVAGGASVGVHAQRARRKGEDPYLRLDFRARVRIGEAWVYVDANNLLGEEYPDVTGSLAPGRALFVGLELAWGGLAGG